MKLLEKFQSLFQSGEKDSDTRMNSAAWEQMAMEIKGSIWSLITLFLLVSLTSYLPLDTAYLFEGHLEAIRNLGGIVGAIFAEAFLGTIGLMGYSVIFFTAYLSFNAFLGKRLKDRLPRLAGAALSVILACIFLNLLTYQSVAEVSLLQGGRVGRAVGYFLVTYFHATGATLLVGGALLITSIFSMGMSILNLFRSFFASDDTDDTEQETEDDETDEEKMASEPRKRTANKKPKKNAGRSKKQKAAKNEEDDDASEEEPLDPSVAQELEEEEELPDADGQSDEDGPLELIPFTNKYEMPSLRLLKNSEGAKRASKKEVKQNSRKLCEHLLSFQVTGEVVSVSEGPVLTTYEYKPTAGIKLKSIAALQDDLGVILGTRELRIIAPIPGKTVVGIEVPRPHIETIALKEIISHKDFQDKKLRIPIAIGKTTDGQPVFADLAAMPHLLVAGATGSGKSVFINSLVMSLIYRLPPQQLRMILVDPKMLELNTFDGIPHLLTNVITNPNVAFNALNWAVDEMERRYSLMAETGSKNIDSYNSKVKSTVDKLPYIVIVVDELADLMLSGGEAVEIAITRLAQKARAAGLHMVIATQRPSTEVITGLIKANIPSRISFKVPSSIDSRTILDSSGAEELIGRGDMLMIQPAVPMRRLHGCFVSEEEIHRAVKAIRRRENAEFYIQFSEKKPEEE